MFWNSIHVNVASMPRRFTRERILLGSWRRLVPRTVVWGCTVSRLSKKAAESGGCEGLTASLTGACWNLATWEQPRFCFSACCLNCRPHLTENRFSGSCFLKSRQRETFAGRSPCCFGLWILIRVHASTYSAHLAILHIPLLPPGLACPLPGLAPAVPVLEPSSSRDRQQEP